MQCMHIAFPGTSHVDVRLATGMSCTDFKVLSDNGLPGTVLCVFYVNFLCLVSVKCWLLSFAIAHNVSQHDELAVYGWLVYGSAALGLQLCDQIASRFFVPGMCVAC